MSIKYTLIKFSNYAKDSVDIKYNGHTKKEFTADVYVDLSQIIKGHVLDMELLKEHSSIEPLDLPKEMEELLKEC